MRISKNIFIIVIFSFFLFVAAACQSAESNEAPETAVETVQLRIAKLPYISNTVLMIAEEEGYFDEQGLDVEFVPFQNTNDLITLLAAGELDAAAPSASAGFFNAISRGGNIRIILPLTDFEVKECSTVAYLARTEDVESGRLDDKASWPDAKLVVSTQALNSIPGYVLGKVLSPVGLTVEDMQIEVVNIPAQEEALRSGQVDIVYAVEPWVARMTAQGDIAVLDNAELYAPGMTASMIMAGPKIYDNPDVGNRFAIAYLKAVRQYLEGPTERNVELAMALTSLPEDLIRSLCWSSSSPDGSVSMDYVMDYQNWLMDRGLLDELIEPEAFYEPAFATHAVEILGSAAP